MTGVTALQNQDSDYARWLDHHAHGFVLNLKPRTAMLHKSRCSHLYPTKVYKHPTRVAKWCSNDRSPIENAARRENVTFVGCQSCKT